MSDDKEIIFFDGSDIPEPVREALVSLAGAVAMGEGHELYGLPRKMASLGEIERHERLHYQAHPSAYNKGRWFMVQDIRRLIEEGALKV